MCPPVLAVASLAMTALSTVQQASAASAQAKHQKAVALQNQRVATLRANDAIVRGQQDQRELIQEGQKEEQRFRIDAAKALGQQKAAFAANGSLLDPDSSAGMTLMQTAEQGAHNAAIIRSNTRRAVFQRNLQANNDAWAMQVQATNFVDAASAAASRGRNAVLGTALSGGASLLAGARKVSEKWQ